MPLDRVDRKLLNLIQTDFPLTREPYATLGQELGIEADMVIQRISRLKEERMVRLIGPILNTESLGYRSTLVAMRVDETHLSKAEQLIAAHPGVSHGYERNHLFNVWFTLALPPSTDIADELKRIGRDCVAEAIFSLPSLRVFKLTVFFDMDGDGHGKPNHRHHIQHQPVALSATDKLVINELQTDLPLIPAPFDRMAERTGMAVAQFLATSQSLQKRGVIRRFSANINHHRAGFAANAMTCWIAPTERIGIAGEKLASLTEVSHCYERQTNPLWQHNLFAMIHGHSRECCEEVAHRVSVESRLSDCIMLYSTKEFKKTRVKYSV